MAIFQNISKSKQTAESKQRSELIKNSKFSFQTSLLWALSPLEVSKWLIIYKSKQTADSKQTAENKHFG